MSKRPVIVAAFVLVWTLPAAATASPWVLREDEMVVSGQFYFQQADREFLEEGQAQAFPLNGRYRATTYETSVRLGLVEDFELALNLPLKQVAYKADPVILSPCSEDASNAECFQENQENVLDFSNTAAGLGDIRFAGRYQFLRGPVVGAVGVHLKVPTGYDRPAGTFGREPKDKQEFQSQTATLVRPENVQDDVTLGDGQTDLGLLALWGWSLPTRTFLRLDSGYLLRMGGAGDQVVADFQVGQQLGKRF